MFRKWPKTYRILVNQVDVKGKHYLSDFETKQLLAGQVSITEKIDGANVAIIRHKNDFKLQKRGSLVDESEHPQFGFLKSWSENHRDKILKIPTNTILYGELCCAVHSIYYDRLPDWFVAFGWYDRKNDRYFHRDKMTKMCDSVGLTCVPEVFRGFTRKDDLFDLIPNVSNFGTEKAEGIVVEKLKDGSRGKLVREEFVKNIGIHWSKNSIRWNKLNV